MPCSLYTGGEQIRMSASREKRRVFAITCAIHTHRFAFLKTALLARLSRGFARRREFKRASMTFGEGLVDSPIAVPDSLFLLVIRAFHLV
jgi:hypothetical protein